jgi:hypothetical protein
LATSTKPGFIGEAEYLALHLFDGIDNLSQLKNSESCTLKISN